MTEGTQTPETEPLATEPVTEGGEDQPEGEAKEEKKKLNQIVDITDAGPCKKHIKVTVPRADLDDNIENKYKELVGDSWIPGFRPGKAPRSVVIRKFKKDVNDRVKGEILMQSLEQLAEEFDVAPLSPPDLKTDHLEIPDKGDFVYEFNVEVRPHFDLPEYKGLKLKKPVHTYTEADVNEEEKRVLANEGQLVPKDGPAEKGDFIICDMLTAFGNDKVGEAKEITLRIDDTLTFKDGVASKFAEQMVGVKAGEKRSVDISMTDAVAVDRLKGQTIKGTFDVKDVKALRLPDLDEHFLERHDCKTVDEFRERLRLTLDYRLMYRQRQSAREQVLNLIAASANWELPQDLLQRQARKTLARRVMEMREARIPEEEIRSRQRMLERDVLTSTALAMKEHFVLQKIAEQEKLDLEQQDIDDEIERLADQYRETPRRIRAQLERDDLMETLAAQLIERKALDLILNSAVYEEVPIGKEEGMATVDAQAVPGEMKDPTAAPAAEEKPPEDAGQS
jgi:trigger factor